MNYEDAWNELKEKLDKAENGLNELRLNISPLNPEEHRRLQSKKEGVKLAKQYMYDIERALV